MKDKRRKLNNSRVLVGITGSVAAYKTVDLIRRLKDEGALVKVIMTSASSRFITPLSVELAAGEGNTYCDMFDDPMSHIELAVKSDLMVVAPATANSIGKFANGIADDLLSACYMAFMGHVVIAPAMNWRMYESAAFRRNLDFLKEQGATEVEPEEGPLACGEFGKGRMAPVEDILDAAKASLMEKDLTGSHVLVTAGPTREHLDDVRFISNLSSGKMGYSIAKAAKGRGARVTLISGPSALNAPSGVSLVSVTSADEMRKAVISSVVESDALIMCAAVADFTPGTRLKGKGPKDTVNGFELRKTPDILLEVGAVVGKLDKKPLIIGFAAESGEDTKRAEKKRVEKGADYIIFNNISDPEAGFNVDTNRITVLGEKAPVEYPLMSKDDAAQIILDLISKNH
jgi:phosphopantothenoylcysteine decarboxylase/phosphopantothenate--cysteine ligase